MDHNTTMEKDNGRRQEEDNVKAMKLLTEDYKVLVKANTEGSIEASVSEQAMFSISTECLKRNPDTRNTVCNALIKTSSDRSVYGNFQIKPIRCVFGMGSFTYLYDKDRSFNVIHPGLRVSFRAFKMNILKQIINLRQDAGLTSREDTEKIKGIVQLAKNCVLAHAYTDILMNHCNANAWYFHRSPNKDGHIFPTQLWYGKQLSIMKEGSLSSVPVLDCGSGEWKLNTVPGAKPVSFKIVGESFIIDKNLSAQSGSEYILRVVNATWNNKTGNDLPSNTQVIMTGVYRDKIGPKKEGNLHILTSEEEAGFEKDAIDHAIKNANLRTVNPTEIVGSFAYGNGSTQGRINDRLISNSTGLNDKTLHHLVSKYLLLLEDDTTTHSDILKDIPHGRPINETLALILDRITRKLETITQLNGIEQFSKKRSHPSFHRHGTTTQHNKRTGTGAGASTGARQVRTWNA